MPYLMSNNKFQLHFCKIDYKKPPKENSYGLQVNKQTVDEFNYKVPI